MSVYAPDTDLRLIKSPLTYGDGHQLDFATAAAQATYFQSLPGVSYTDFTYQRKDRTIRIADIAENLYQYNYVMYRNKTSAKWFYAFIEKIEFVNQNCTHVVIKTDVFQTWMFELTVRRCLIKREHVADDGVFKHTLPESIGCGNTKVRNTSNVIPSGTSLYSDTYADFNTNYWCCIVSSQILQYISSDTVPATNYYSGNANACYYYAVPISSLYPFINKVNTDGQIDAIIAVIAVPKAFVNFVALANPSVADAGYLTEKAHPANFTITGNTSDIDGYTPKNKKLFCFPYNYLELQTGDSSKTIRYEYFNTPNSQHSFIMRYMLSISPIYGASPAAYDGQSVNERCGVTFQSFPLIPYGYSAYKDYMARHANSLSMNLIETGAVSAYGAVMGNPQAAVNGINELTDFITQQSDAAKQPREMRGQLTGNWLSCIGKNSVYLHMRTIRREYAQIVDDYFSMYGYRVDRLGVPQWNSRPYWNFIQLENPDISANCPQDDADELKRMFEVGLTIWHNPTYFGDYTRDNSPVTP